MRSPLRADETTQNREHSNTFARGRGAQGTARPTFIAFDPGEGGPFARTAPFWLSAFGRNLLLAIAFLVASLAWGEDEMEVGRNASGQLVVQIEFEQPLVLPVSVFPGISGYATGEVGLHSALFDDPGNDFFQLSPAADFRFILLAKDSGIEVWNDTGSSYMNVGESFYIGPPPFDTHPVWNITTGTPTNAYSLTLKLHDVNAVYPDSASFVLSFTPIAPAQLKIKDNGDNTVSVFLEGSPRAEYAVQVATTLAGGGDWVGVATNTTSSDGTWTFIETKAGHISRYFRSVNR